MAVFANDPDTLMNVAKYVLQVNRAFKVNSTFRLKVSAIERMKNGDVMK